MESSIEVPRSKSSKLSERTINQLIDAHIEKYSFLKSSEEDEDALEMRMSLREELGQNYKDLANFVETANSAKEHRRFFVLKRKSGNIPTSTERLISFAGHWNNFASNSAVREVFGEDKLNLAEEKLSRDLLEKALSPERQEQREVMGVIDELNNSIVAPFVVLNKYNPFNLYGEKDFGFKKIKEYLSGFSKEKLKELEDSNVPGLKEIIEMKDPSGFRSQVIRIAIHFLQSGNIQEKLYIARDTSAKIMSQETRGQIQAVLEAPNTPGAVRLEFFTSKISKDRATTNSLALGMLFSYLTRNRNPQLLSLLKFNEGRVLDGFINKEELTPQDIKDLSGVLGTAEDQTQKAILFAKDQKKINPELKFTHHERSTEGTVSKLIRLATDKDIPPLLAELSKCGYSLTTYQSGMNLDLFDRLLKEKERLLPFIQELHEKGGYRFSDIGDIEILEELIIDRDSLISALSDIRKYDPNFKYHILPYGEEYLNPYKQFISHIDTSSGFSYASLIAIKRDKGSLPNEFSDFLFEALRPKLMYSKDVSLRKSYFDLRKTEASPEIKVAFEKAINIVLEYVQKHPDLQWFYSDNAFLGVLTIRPDEAKKMATLPERFPELISLMEQGGPLYTNRENVFNSIFAGEDFDRQVQEIVTIFTKKQPYWEMLYFYTEKRLRTALINAKTSYPVYDPTSFDRRSPFNSLTESDKLKTFKEYLKIVIESSRSEVAKKEADQKNRTFLEEKLTLVEGDYIHGTAVDHLPEVLLNGNLCGEALGQYARADSNHFRWI